MLNEKTPFTISKQTYSQLNCAAWMVPIPPAESDFSPTFFFFLIIKNTDHLPSP